MHRRTARIGTVALAVFAAAAVWVVSTTVFPHHSLNHDEGVYLQQAAMLLEGQLTLRPPFEGSFRPWFFVDDGGRLYPKYAPVTAAIFALGSVVGEPRLALAGVAAGIVALTAAVGSETFDRRTGLFAGAFVLCSPLFLLDASVFLPYAPTTLLNLGFAYSYLRADRTGDVRLAAVVGGSIGLAFFARPFTAVLFATPFLIHALWRFVTGDRDVRVRQSVTAAVGLTGVAVALAYNATVTGSPWLFPYEAFAPLDGIGFGRRRILDHAVDYTPELALRANRKVATLLFSKWIAGGILGAGLAAVGLGVSARRGLDDRRLLLAGLFPAVLLGNVYFWGNLNVLGDLDRAGDGLVGVLGPYYHFDLLVPTAVFAATGALAAFDVVRRRARAQFAPERATAFVVAVVLVSAAVLGTVTVGGVAEPIDRSARATDTYESAYEPFQNESLENAVVLLPTPYGDWLNHPFQWLRNDPGYDGDVVYALDDRPFAVADAFPDRALYRYGYRGHWSPTEGSPDAARLQPVEDVSGERVDLDATVGIPDGVTSVTIRLGTEDGSSYYVAENASDEVDFRITLRDGSANLAGGVRSVGNASLEIDRSEVVRTTVFLDSGAAGGTTYRFDTPVRVHDGTVRALTPRIEWCRDARTCGGAATYVPGAVPEDIFVSAEVTASAVEPGARSENDRTEANA